MEPVDAEPVIALSIGSPGRRPVGGDAEWTSQKRAVCEQLKVAQLRAMSFTVCKASILCALRVGGRVAHQLQELAGGGLGHEPCSHATIWWFFCTNPVNRIAGGGIEGGGMFLFSERTSDLCVEAVFSARKSIS